MARQGRIYADFAESQWYAELDVAEAMARTIPHKERYLLLNHALARRIVDAHSEWLDEVERELGARDRRRAGSRKRR
jgi:hypothetical protein